MHGSSNNAGQSLLAERSYLEDELLDPGPLRQEVQHREAGVGSHSRHADPVAATGAGPDVVGEAGQVVHKGVHPALVEPSHVHPERGESATCCLSLAWRGRV